MGFFDVLSTVGNIIMAPLNLLGDIAREPLRGFEHKRHLRENEQQANLAIKQEAERARLEREKEKYKFELSEQEKENELQRKIKEEENAVNLSIKRETEVTKILMEIEQLKKDKEFARMKAVSEAIVQYQERLTKINVEAITAIGSMQLDLRNKAYDMISERTRKCKEFQNEVMHEAIEEYQIIEEKFPNNEMAKNVLTKAVEVKMVGMINATNNFLDELNRDISLINNSINLLAESGQKFIENHLEQFNKQTSYQLTQNDKSEPIMYINEGSK